MASTVETRLPSRYRLIQEVGQGGMAVVYRAEDKSLGREVAIKVLHPHLLEEADSKARLVREAQAVAKLQHDNILQVFDFSTGSDPASYIVTEFIDGQTLKQFLQQRNLPIPELAALIAIEIGNALAHAHAAGIIHRDVKPENVMVRRDGALKLMDFGVAQIVTLERMTVTGQLLGSPAYMSPELVDGKPLDFRTDVFSLGIMLYQMACGSLPFSGRNPHEVLKRIAEARYTDPRTLNRLVSDGLARIIARALARSPDDRYQSVESFVADLTAYVRAAGLEVPREELRRFFTDPKSYENEVVGRAVSALVAAGKRARAAGRAASALELWNRALALDPGNAAVTRELRRLEGRSRLLRRLATAGIVTAGIVGIFALFHVASREATSLVESAAPVPAPVPEAPPPSSIASTPAPSAALPARPAAASAPRAPTQAATPASARDGKAGGGPGSTTGARPDRPPAPTTTAVPPPPTPPPTPAPTASGAPTPAPTRRFTLGPTPAQVEVWLDGEKQFHWGRDRSTLEIPWDGPHVITFRNDACCFPSEEIRVGPGLPLPRNDHIVARLRGRPALLSVRVEPAGQAASVGLRDRSAEAAGRQPWRATARAGEVVTIPFDDAGVFQKDVEIIVSASDKVARRLVSVTAGQRRDETIALP